MTEKNDRTTNMTFCEIWSKANYGRTIYYNGSIARYHHGKLIKWQISAVNNDGAF